MAKHLDLPRDYDAVLESAKQTVRSAQVRAVRLVNTALIELNWSLGRLILERQAEHGWGAKVIDRLAADLRSEFPTMKGLSPRNLRYMRTFAAAWPEAIGQQAAAQLGWGHIMVILDKLTDPEDRDWYAAEAARHGWTRDLLLNHIKNQTRRRIGAAPSNFGLTLTSEDSELAQGLTRDPYVLDFIRTNETLSEKQLEDALVDRLRDLLDELGHGFAYLGRQVKFEVDGKDFFVDLLFFHVYQLRHVVIELKIGDFTPRDAGQLEFYVTIVDEQLRDPEHHRPTVGILLVADRSDTVVEYALRTKTSPLAVATYTYDELPDDVRSDLPTPQAVIGAVQAAVSDGDRRRDITSYLQDHDD